MDAVVALTGNGGWPMTVFLTPTGEPFLGGTYFPPEPRHGLPSFRQVLVAVSDAYRERHDEVVAQAQSLTESIRAAARVAAADEPLTGALLEQAVDGLRSCSDAARRSPRERRSTGWRRAACTTCSAAASTATRSTRAGSCRTSRRCCTTTRCSFPPTYTGGSSPATRVTATSSRRPLPTCCASSSCRRAASHRRRTRTRTASRA